MSSEPVTTDAGTITAGLSLLGEIPQLDVAVHRLIKALSDEDISERELAGIIEQCPTLSGKIVGLANSAYFRREKPIYSLQDAIRLIGLRTVKSFAIASALQEPFSNIQCPAFHPGRFWLHDVLTAHAARELTRKLSKKFKLHPEEAYLAGLLHNIGLLALAHLFPNQLNEILSVEDKTTHQLMPAIEAAFGASSFVVSAALLRHWHLPEPFVAIAEHYMSADYQGTCWALSRIVGIADEWATHIVQQENDTPFNKTKLLTLGLSEADTESIRQKCLDQLDTYVELSEIISGQRPEFQSPTVVATAAIELKDRLTDTLESLSSIRALSDLNIKDKSEKEIIDDALQILMENQDMQRCSLFLNKDSSLVNVAGLSWDEHFTSSNKQQLDSASSYTFKMGEGIIGIVAQSGELKHSQNCAEDPAFKKIQQTHDYVPGSLICVPVCFQGASLGVLNVSHKDANVYNDWDERFLIVFANMLGQLIVYHRIMHDMDAEINLRTKQLQAALAKAESLSTLDELTGIHNRRYFLEHFNKLIAHCDRYNTNAAVLMIDIDDFKVINDTFGHIEGDKVIIKVAEAIKDCARETDIIARLGGEEFIFALHHADCTKAEQVAERVLQKIRLINCGGKEGHHITASVGISCYGPVSKVPGKSVEKWMQEADKALYQAKHSGKDCIAKFH